MLRLYCALSGSKTNNIERDNLKADSNETSAHQKRLTFIPNNNKRKVGLYVDQYCIYSSSRQLINNYLGSNEISPFLCIRRKWRNINYSGWCEKRHPPAPLVCLTAAGNLL